MITPLALVLALAGAAWGYTADRIGARWPAHEDGSIRARDWRTVATVVTGAVALGLLPVRFSEPVALVVFGCYLAALVLGVATDLDQRLLPNLITYPAIPIALAFGLTGANPLVHPDAMLIVLAFSVLVPGALYLFSLPFGAGAFGLGDVKLLVSVGLFAGVYRLFAGVVYGALLAGVVLIVLLVLRRITLKSYVPFGPFLILGAMAAILLVP